MKSILLKLKDYSLIIGVSFMIFNALFGLRIMLWEQVHFTSSTYQLLAIITSLVEGGNYLLILYGFFKFIESKDKSNSVSTFSMTNILNLFAMGLY